MDQSWSQPPPLTLATGGGNGSGEIETKGSVTMTPGGNASEGPPGHHSARLSAKGPHTHSRNRTMSPTSPRAVSRAFYDFVQNMEGKSLDQSMWAPKRPNIAKPSQAISRVHSQQRTPTFSQEPNGESHISITPIGSKQAEAASVDYLDASTQTLLTSLMHVDLDNGDHQSHSKGTGFHFQHIDRRTLDEQPHISKATGSSSLSPPSTQEDNILTSDEISNKDVDVKEMYSPESKMVKPPPAEAEKANIVAEVKNIEAQINNTAPQGKYLAPHQRARLSSPPVLNSDSNDSEAPTVEIAAIVESEDAEPGEVALTDESPTQVENQQEPCTSNVVTAEKDSTRFDSNIIPPATDETEGEKIEVPAAKQADAVQEQVSTKDEVLTANSVPPPTKPAPRKSTFDPTAYSSRRQVSKQEPQVDRTDQRFFDNWGTVEKRDRPTSKIRTVILTALPLGADPAFVASVVYGGALEQIHMRGGGSAAVRFLDGDDATNFYDDAANGLVYGKAADGREKVIWVQLGKDVDVIGGLLGEWIKLGRTRCIKAIHVDKGISLQDITLFASKNNRTLESVEESFSDNKSRIIVFRFAKIDHAIQFRGVLARDEAWEHCNISFITDPCEVATGPRCKDSGSL